MNLRLWICGQLCMQFKMLQSFEQRAPFAETGKQWVPSAHRFVEMEPRILSNSRGSMGQQPSYQPAVS